jgi:hypothetical protein
MTSIRLRRIVAAAFVTVLGLSFAMPVQGAEEGPDFYQGVANSSTLKLAVGLPAVIADLVGPILEPAGITLEDNALVIDLSLANVDLEKLSEADAAGKAGALAVSGSLAGLVETLAGDALNCLDVPIDIAVPPNVEHPLLSLTVLPTECDDDPSDGVVSSRTKIADLSIDLRGVLETLPPELAQAIDDAVTEVEDQVLTPVVGVVNDLLNTVGDTVEPVLGEELELGVLKPLDLISELPLVDIGLIEAETISVFDGASVTSTSSTTVAGVQVLNTLCILADDATEGTTFVANAAATGKSTDYSTVIPNITVGICGDNGGLDRTLIKLVEDLGILPDVLVNLDGENEVTLVEYLSNSDLPLSDILEQVDQLLVDLGFWTVLAGSENLRSQNDQFVDVAVDPASVQFLPLGNVVSFAGTPLDGLSVNLYVGANQATAFGAVQAASPSPPQPAEPNLPKTGGGVMALLFGSLAIGGAALLRRR